MKMCKVIGSRYLMQVDRAGGGTGWWAWISRWAGRSRVIRRRVAKDNTLSRVGKLGPIAPRLGVQLLPLLHGKARRMTSGVGLVCQDGAKVMVNVETGVGRVV